MKFSILVRVPVRAKSPLLMHAEAVPFVRSSLNRDLFSNQNQRALLLPTHFLPARKLFRSREDYHGLCCHCRLVGNPIHGHFAYTVWTTP